MGSITHNRGGFLAGGFYLETDRRLPLVPRPHSAEFWGRYEMDNVKEHLYKVLVIGEYGVGTSQVEFRQNIINCNNFVSPLVFTGKVR